VSLPVSLPLRLARVAPLRASARRVRPHDRHARPATLSVWRRCGRPIGVSARTIATHETGGVR
jgi:hypothetical protein